MLEIIAVAAIIAALSLAGRLLQRPAAPPDLRPRERLLHARTTRSAIRYNWFLTTERLVGTLRPISTLEKVLNVSVWVGVVQRQSLAPRIEANLRDVTSAAPASSTSDRLLVRRGTQTIHVRCASHAEAVEWASAITGRARGRA